MSQLPVITNYVVNYQIGIMTVGRLLAYAMPFFLQFVLPMSIMIAVLLTFLRMSGDMEIVALKAGGVTIYRLLPPVLVFGLIGTLLTGLIAVYALPNGRKATKELLFEVASSHVDIGLKPRQFIDSFKGVVLYVHAIDPNTKILKDVFIEDRRSPDLAITVVAPSGRISFDPVHFSVNLRLKEGSIHQVNLKETRANDMKFDTYDIRLEMQRKVDGLDQRPMHVEEMGLFELYRSIKGNKHKDEKYYKALLELHKKFSLPAACLALGILAVPLGIRARSSKRAYGVGLGLLFFLLYYILLSTGWVLGESGAYPPAIGMWVPNLLSLAVGIVLLVRTANEKPIVLPPMPRWITRLQFGRRQTPRV
jgi:lipopolysaccharide export system permease protein